MGTLKYWLIANFEIAILLLTLIIGGITIWGLGDGLHDNITHAGLAVLGLVLLFVIPTQRGTLQFGKYILMLGGVIFFAWFLKNSEGSNMTDADIALWEFCIRRFWIVFSIATAISVFFAVYAFINFDEVVSRRMSWRNSNVSLFEISILYTLDRFCNITVSIVICTLGLMFLWYIPDIPITDNKETATKPAQIETVIEPAKAIQATEIQPAVEVDIVEPIVFEEESNVVKIQNSEIFENETQIIETLNETDD